MIPSAWIFGCGALALALALIARIARRGEATSVRVASLLALAAVWFAAGDWPVSRMERVPAELHVVATVAGSGPWRDRLEAARDAEVTVVAAGGGDPTAALLAAALRARDARDVALVWDGPFAPGVAEPRAVRGAGVFTVQPPASVEAADLALRALGAIAVGRPAALEVGLLEAARASLGPDATARLSITDPAGAQVLVAEIPAEQLRSASAPRVEWIPAMPGAHAVRLEVTLGEYRVGADGTVEVVAAAGDVLVVGPGAATVVAALQAQGVRARGLDDLPADLPDPGVVVVLGALDEPSQERLDLFCDEGGGLVLVGGDGGGALPRADAPLAAACPLVALPPAQEVDGGGGPGDGAEGEPGGEPSDQPGDAEPGEAPPGPTGERPPEDPDAAVVGDTSAAQGTGIEDAEVERRSIALVLVIDRSGSMAEPVRGASTRMDFAKRSAYETARQLEDGDELGVVAFGARAYEVLQLGPIPDERELRVAIERLRASDSATLLADAVERAGAWLTVSSAAVRHAVIITDGDNLDPGDLTRAQAASRRMARAGVTVSLIQIASTRFGLAGDIARIASLGGGQFVRETDGGAIPRLVFAEVRRALGAAGRRPDGGELAAGPGGDPGPGEPDAGPSTDPTGEPTTEPPDQSEPADEEPETEPSPPDRPDPAMPDPEAVALRVVALEDSPLLEPVPAEGFPDLRGVHPVAAARRAHVLLATADGTPLLAFAHRGLGRVAAWSSDWTGPWSEAWRDDPHFPARLATWVSAVRPAPAVASDADCLTGERWSTPAAPSRAECAALLAATGSVVLRGIEELTVPAPRVVSRQHGRASDLALLALSTLLLLAFVEWRSRHR